MENLKFFVNSLLESILCATKGKRKKITLDRAKYKLFPIKIYCYAVENSIPKWNHLCPWHFSLK